VNTIALRPVLRLFNDTKDEDFVRVTWIFKVKPGHMGWGMFTMLKQYYNVRVSSLAVQMRYKIYDLVTIINYFICIRNGQASFSLGISPA